MNSITYIGEHLLVGKIGNLFVILSFVFSLASAYSYFKFSKNPLDNSWKKLSRIFFFIHGFAVIGIASTLFYMIFNHYFEYEYVWHHSSKNLPLRYILSCFWEGQEGSFLLWSFWHVVLGFILIKTSGTWEGPLMSVFSIVQAFLASMLLGIYVFEYRIGSNPFTVLLREHPEYSKIPLFGDANYLERLDGRGLNPLLQNYWMTIHPPTLFLGFAATLIPFAYAIGGLFTKRYHEWQKPALPWTFFGIMILGTGILMGGAWAYEALSFGGFWAWDPVENASLVPWLTLVGAAHVLLIHKTRGTSVLATLFLTCITFILILYSTFLTRSGILGETSVHAFTDLGMSGQLLIYLLFFVALAAFLIIKNYKHFPKDAEEAMLSREFWMFIGSIVLLISAFQITYTTSIPVWNKLFHLNMAPPAKAIDHYNAWQIPFAIIIALLIGTSQFFKYKNTDRNEWIKKITLSLVVSILISAAIIFALSLYHFLLSLLLFASVFAVIANTDYLFRILKGKIKNGGASIAHIGFAFILLGALLSTSGKKIISQNTSGQSVEALGKDFSNATNIMLTQNDTLMMGDYFVTYKGKKKEGENIYFEVEYLSKLPDGSYKHEFTLHPLVQTNPRMGNVAEPDTRHFLHKDIYTHITFADLETIEKETINNSDWQAEVKHTLKKGDTLFTANCIAVFEDLNLNVNRKQYNLIDNDIAVAAVFKVYDFDKKTYTAEPIFMIRDKVIQPVAAFVYEVGLKLTFWKIITETGEIEVTHSEKKNVKPEFIVMEAMVFPYINILWIGCIVMIIGTCISIRQRIKTLK